MTHLFDTITHAALVVCCAWMLATGCTARPQAREPERGETPWCVSMRLKFDGESESGRVCASRLAVCQNVRSRAVRFGGAAGLTEVGECLSEP
jgi:hypothetical protein